MNCVIITYCCAVLFPVDLVTKRAIIGGGQKSVFSSFLADFSARLARSIPWAEGLVMQWCNIDWCTRQQDGHWAAITQNTPPA